MLAASLSTRCWASTLTRLCWLSKLGETLRGPEIGESPLDRTRKRLDAWRSGRGPSEHDNAKPKRRHDCRPQPGQPSARVTTEQPSCQRKCVRAHKAQNSARIGNRSVCDHGTRMQATSETLTTAVRAMCGVSSLRVLPCRPIGAATLKTIAIVDVRELGERQVSNVRHW